MNEVTRQETKTTAAHPFVVRIYNYREGTRGRGSLIKKKKGLSTRRKRILRFNGDSISRANLSENRIVHALTPTNLNSGSLDYLFQEILLAFVTSSITNFSNDDDDEFSVSAVAEGECLAWVI